MVERTIMTNFKEILVQKEYDFLYTNPHLGNNIILLGLGGSHAYGTNIETSDVDIRGIAMEKPENLLGFNHFEQVEDPSTDTVIYAFNKMVQLLINNNPNIVEILGLRPDHYLYLSSLGKELLDHKHLFLSQKSYYTFGGYAKAQLKRLENALARDNYPEEKKNEHICISLEAAIDAFNSQKGTDLNPAFAYVDENGALRYRLNMDIDSRDLEAFYSTVSNTTKNYKELLNRNRKKGDAKLCKHAMHLARLLATCLDLLNTGDIITYREKDHDLLMSIRNGEFMGEDGNMTPEFYKLVADLETQCEEALKTTKLPKKSNVNEIEKWVIDVNKRIINGEFQEEFKL